MKNKTDMWGALLIIAITILFSINIANGVGHRKELAIKLNDIENTQMMIITNQLKIIDLMKDNKK